jgi:hypothetical protein
MHHGQENGELDAKVAPEGAVRGGSDACQIRGRDAVGPARDDPGCEPVRGATASPDELLDALAATDSEHVRFAVAEMATRHRRPPMTPSQLLDQVGAHEPEVRRSLPACPVNIHATESHRNPRRSSCARPFASAPDPPLRRASANPPTLTALVATPDNAMSTVT